MLVLHLGGLKDTDFQFYNLGKTTGFRNKALHKHIHFFYKHKAYKHT